MDLYEENEHIISSDEYSDGDDDDDALMNDAVRAQGHNVRSEGYTERNKQPKWAIDQKQKELSSLIRRNKISVIYKNKSIKWLNNKRQRERYKERIYFNAKNINIGQINSTPVICLEEEQIQNSRIEFGGQKDHTLQIQDIVSIDEDDKDEEITVLQNISTANTQITNSSLEKAGKMCDEESKIPEGKFISHTESLKSSIEKTEKNPLKRPRSTSPSDQNESNEKDMKHSEKKFRVVSSEFYRYINDMFPEYDKILTNHIDTVANNLLAYVENKMKNLSNEIDTLSEILKVKEMEFNRLSHLKMVKEEIYSRLKKKRHVLDLKESFSNKQDENVLLELKELEFYLSDNKSTTEAKHSSQTTQKLIENRANMNSDDLKREKNNTSRLHSLLVSQNMLHAAETVENSTAMSNGEQMDLGLTSKNAEFYNHFEGGRLMNNRGRQGEVRDVKSLIADFRQKNPELLPRVGKRIKSNETNAHHLGYSIPLFDKTSRAHIFTKDQPEFYSLQNSADEISITPIGRSKKLSSGHDIDFVNAVNNHYNVRLEDNFLKSQVKGDFNGKSSRNIPYPQCQECKTKESRFVCAGCGNQWYCSKKCQISAWDKHSDLCTE